MAARALHTQTLLVYIGLLVHIAEQFTAGVLVYVAE